VKSVFISYARKDAPIAWEIARALASRGVSVATDQDLEVGEDWQDRIEESMDRSDIALLCVSPDYLDSKWAQFEIGYWAARTRNGSGVKATPILLGDTPMPKLLSHLNGIDARDLSTREIVDKVMAKTLS
jgi:hypothetical protein